MVQKSVDAVVIGGGILGAATAYHLTKFGAEVCLVERGAVASGTSGACDGQILIADRHPGPELELGKLALRRWDELARELPIDIEYEAGGSTLIAEVEEDVTALAHLVDSLQGEGVRAHILQGPEMRDLEPELAEDIPGLAWFPDHAQVQPQLACWGMAQAAREGGAILETHSEVVAIERGRRGRVSSVVTSNGPITTPVVVNAAGAWSPTIGEMVGIRVPVRPRRGHIVVTEPVPPILRHSAMEASYTRTIDADDAALQVAMVIEHTKSGTMLFGSSREFVDFDRRESLEAIRGIVRRAIRFFPALARIQAIRCYTGFRPYTPDHLPILGECEQVPGFYLATGHEGGGICMGPISGKLVAQKITGQTPDLPLKAYSISRFDRDSKSG